MHLFKYALLFSAVALLLTASGGCCVRSGDDSGAAPDDGVVSDAQGSTDEPVHDHVPPLPPLPPLSEEDAKPQTVGEQVEEKQERAYGFLRKHQFEQAKVEFESIRQIPGVSRSQAAKAGAAKMVQMLIDRRNDPRRAEEVAAKERLILAAAQDVADISSDLPELRRKTTLLRLKMTENEATAADVRRFQRYRQFMSKDRVKARTYGTLQVLCALRPVEDTVRSNGISPGTVGTINHFVEGQLMSRWNEELQYAEVLAMSQADSPSDKEHAKRDARHRHVAALIEGLSAPQERWRVAAARALARVAPPADHATPALALRLTDDSVNVRRAAVNALAAFGPQAADAVEGLIQSLQDEDSYVRSQSAYALGNIGPAAKNATSALTAALEDSTTHDHAKKALEQINAGS